jgi:hypothetical protein
MDIRCNNEAEMNLSFATAASQLCLLSIVIASADDMSREALVMLLVSAVGAVRLELGMDFPAFREWLKSTSTEEDLDVFMETVDCLERCAGNKCVVVH